VAAPLTPQQSAFIEEMGQFLGGYGMTPMAGRMWGWLLLCDPPEQTAADIADALGASRGAISGTARILTSAGFIRRTKKRGDRREYFSSPPEALDSMLMNAGAVYRQLREIAEHGVAAAGDSPSARARLEEFRDVITFIETELPRLLDRFFRERSGDLPPPAPVKAPLTSSRHDATPAGAG
jgi:DNA-binding transcriptional regulator GbsR (MarR family)